MGEISFVTGGARSGKSRFAERIAAGSGRAVVFLATMEPLDAELELRVARHRSDRPPTWSTVEEPREVVEAAQRAEPNACLVIDCLSLWVSNLVLDHLGEMDEPEPGFETHVTAVEQAVEDGAARLLDALGRRPGPSVVVSNEVGSGIVPERFMVRIYRDLLGQVNRRVADAAIEAWLLVAGRALPLPPGETLGGR